MNNPKAPSRVKTLHVGLLLCLNQTNVFGINDIASKEVTAISHYIVG